MKYTLIYLAVILSFLACDKEEDLNVEYDKGKYYISDDPQGEIQKYIYDFYKNYNTIILTKTDTSDYKYNFTSSNKIYLVNPIEENIYKEDISEESKEILQAGFDLMEEVFTGLYTDDFKKAYLPVTIQLADTIKKWEYGNDTVYVDSYAGMNFIAISHINDKTNKISDEDKSNLKKNINTTFWYNYMSLNTGKYNIPNKFYEISGEFYGADEWDTDYDGDWEKSHTKGFILGTEWGMYPSKRQDIESYFNAAFGDEQEKEKFNELKQKYPKIQLKYDILRTVILNEFKVDISKI